MDVLHQVAALVRIRFVGPNQSLKSVAVLLCGVFASGLAVCGYVAAFRNALWTITSLRR